MAGCERSEEGRVGRRLSENTRICVIGPYETHPDWQGIRGGARRYGARYSHIECLAVAPTRDDPELLAALVGTVCDNNPQAVCLVVSDPDVARPIARKIQEHTPPILLVIIGPQLDGVRAYGNVEVDWAPGAGLLGEKLAEVTTGGRSYSLVHNRGRDPVASQCFDRFTVAAHRLADVHELEVRDASAAGVSESELIRELLALYPNTGLMVTLDPEPWLAASPETLLGSNCRFGTLSTAPRLWPALRRGQAAALVGPLHGDIGYAAMDMAVRGLMEIPSATRRTAIPCELVTPGTLDDFAQRYAESAGLSVGALDPFEDVTPAASQPGGG
jgi:ABC-type sugar transport system substrate-binding protein